MRIASSPTLRIATGLLVAVLLSVVGYQVARRLSSHGPEALLKQADGLLRFLGAAETEPSRLLIEQLPHTFSVARHVLAASEPLHAAIRCTSPMASHDSIVDLLLTPDLSWHMPTLSRRPVASH